MKGGDSAFTLVSKEELTAMITALKTVSFYASINHGTKCDDYGEIVNPVLTAMHIKTGEL